jgi:hypothetical protein
MVIRMKLYVSIRGGLLRIFRPLLRLLGFYPS